MQISTLSLRKRLLFASVITLPIFLGFAGFALDNSFIASAKITVRNHLKSEVNALLTALEVSPAGRLILPQRLLGNKLLSLNSGFYGLILDEHGRIAWRSRSSSGIIFDAFSANKPGEESFFQYMDELNSPFVYSFGVSWEAEFNNAIQMTLVVVSEDKTFTQAVHSYRRDLVFWLSMAGVLLIVIQELSLRWGLKPLGNVVRELDQIENANQTNISGVYPAEIAKLTRRINLFIDNERKNLIRYRDTLGDLAHSLKTPLAVIKGITEKENVKTHADIAEHIEHMNKIVEYQLNKAATAQFSTIHTFIDVNPIIVKIHASLVKVYADKNINFQWQLENKIRFYGEEGDIYELIGNIFDNACKWTKSKILVKSAILTSHIKTQEGLSIEIHDDGPGISEAESQAVLNRGTRLDQQVPGQGIGLAVVREIVVRYEGELKIATSELGGAKIQMIFPAI